MGRFCVLCARMRPNEVFGGKGERARICRWCCRLPRTRRDTLKYEHKIIIILAQAVPCFGQELTKQAQELKMGKKCYN